MKTLCFLLSCFLLMFFASCDNEIVEPSPDKGNPNNPEPPEVENIQFLLTSWIWPIADNAVRTYDFNQIQAAGRKTVQVRNWQQIGGLNWQSYQQFTFDFEATDKQVIMTSATGYKEVWDIIEIETTRMLISYKGQQVYVYNCKQAGWPELIRQSMKSCR